MPHSPILCVGLYAHKDSIVQGPGGMSSTPTRCWPCAARHTMAPVTGCLCGTGNASRTSQGHHLLKHRQCSPLNMGGRSLCPKQQGMLSTALVVGPVSTDNPPQRRLSSSLPPQQSSGTCCFQRSSWHHSIKACSSDVYRVRKSGNSSSKCFNPWLSTISTPRVLCAM
jgi:hypothetical protein